MELADRGPDALRIVCRDPGAASPSCSPTQAVGFVLAHLRTTAEAFLQRHIEAAVIAVPARFDVAMHEAVRAAAQLAHLRQVELLPDAVAVALAFGLDAAAGAGDGDGVTEQNAYLVLDFGASALHVSVLERRPSARSGLAVLATLEATAVGGDALDMRLAERVAVQSGLGLASVSELPPRARHRLLLACEQARRGLSNVAEATIELESLWNGRDLSVQLTRARYEFWCVDLFVHAVDAIPTALMRAGITMERVGAVVLAGGVANTPRVVAMATERLPAWVRVHRTAMAEEADATGAALYAARLAGGAEVAGRGGVGDERADALLAEATVPTSIGVATHGGLMHVLIAKGTITPVRVRKTFSTSQDYQLLVVIHVLEGEAPIARHNRLLARLCIDALRTARRGEPRIQLSVGVDVKGTLTVVATHDGREQKVLVTAERLRAPEEPRDTRHSAEDSDDGVADDDGGAAADAGPDDAERIGAREALANTAHGLRNATDTPDTAAGGVLSARWRCRLHREATATIAWLSSLPGQSATTAEYRRRQRELRAICDAALGTTVRSGDRGRGANNAGASDGYGDDGDGDARAAKSAPRFPGFAEQIGFPFDGAFTGVGATEPECPLPWEARRPFVPSMLPPWLARRWPFAIAGEDGDAFVGDADERHLAVLNAAQARAPLRWALAFDGAGTWYPGADSVPADLHPALHLD